MPRERLTELHYFNYKITKETESEMHCISPNGKHFIVDKSDPEPEVWFDDEVDMRQLAY